ncbi:MAG: IS66 family transposase [Campylobacterota bacterium]|nr:IS66 family transposase [Campylobacterota bacterium]
MKKAVVKIEFAIKKPEELDKLSHEELLKYIKELQKNIVQEKPKKDSTNSSIAPSSDISKPKKNQSLRKKSNKASGGQIGHKGTTLIQSDSPDEIIDIAYTLDSCKACHSNLVDEVAQLKEKRQVLDISLSAINRKITQYQSYSKICSQCGYDNHDNTFPVGVTPNISYGNTIMAIVNYFSVVHYLPYKRIISVLTNLYGVSLSEGSIDTLIKRASRLSQDELDKLTKELSLSSIVGIDETGCKVDANKYWHWTFQNNSTTLIVANKSRGAKVINETFEDGFLDACVVHDNYSSYNSLIAKEEQLCLAHKLRDLNYAIECDNTQVMRDIKQLLQEAMIDHKLTLLSQQREILKEQYLLSLDRLLETPSTPKSQTHKQIKSFKRARDKIFTFLLNPNIPPDNNASERAIRNIKVKLKVSGQFKSKQGAIDYANLRSIIDTARKRGMDEFDALHRMINGESLF